MNTRHIISKAAIAMAGLLVLSMPLAALADNAVPSISSISPTAVSAGNASFTLTVNSSNFVPGSMVNFNGSARTTNYVSSNQLTATINATDVTNTGTANINVVSPAPGGGTSNTATLTISNPGNNPVPVVTSISPTNTVVGTGAYTITVNGINFVPNSSVSYNGISRPTTYVSANKLTATIPASDSAVTGTFLVAVTNPAPGGGLSNYVAFQVTGIGTTPQLPNTGFGPTEQPSAALLAGIGLILAMSLAAGLQVKHYLATKN